jgi:hypothetical protein
MDASGFVIGGVHMQDKTPNHFCKLKASRDLVEMANSWSVNT